MEGSSLPGNDSPDSLSEKPQRPWFRSTDFWLIVSLIGLVCSLVWFFYAITRHPQKVSTVIPVVTALTVSRDVPIYRSGLGSVTPVYTVTVKTQINGILTRVPFTEGQMVKAGDLLAQIDPRPYEAQLIQYEGSLKRDTALLANARIDLQRYQRLWKQDSVSQQTLATQESLVRQYEGAVKIDEGLIQSTKINLIYCRITAPIDGRIGLRLVDQGNFVQTSDPSGIAVINTINPITVIFSLPEDNVPQIIPQVYADKTLEVKAYDRQQNQLLSTGTLLTIDNHIDSTTGTVRLKAIFQNKDNQLFPNQFVNAKILVQTLTKATLVPTAAIQHTLSEEFVYLLHADETVSIHPVKTGPVSGDETVIVSGLAPGQSVVVSGTDKLKNGAKVAVKQRKQQVNDTLPVKKTAFNHPYARSVT